MENQGSHYDHLLNQLNEDMGLEPRDVEKEIRMAFENTDDGRSLDINEWDVVFEDDGWKIVADIGSQWSVTETENAETPFQFDLVGETNESQIDEEDDREEKDDGSMSEEEWDEKLNQARAQRRGEDMEGEKTTDDFLAGGKADDADDGEFDPGQLRKGQHVELEHTDNPAVALEIAKDHLREDPLYYDKLERMEKGECDHPEDDEKYARMGKKNPHKS